MAACLDRNIGLDRLRRTLKRKGPEPLSEDIWEIVFAVHNEDALKISLWFHPDGALVAEDKFVALQKEIFDRLGLLCPIPLQFFGADLERNECCLHVNDARLPVVSICVGEEAGADVLAALREQLLSEPQMLFTKEGVERNLDFLRETAPILVEQVVRRVGLNTVCRVLEALVREGFPVTSLGRILDMLTFARGTHGVHSRYIVFTPDAETPVWKPTGDTRLTAEDYLRAVRTNLKREITYRYADRSTRAVSRKMRVVLLDTQIEERLRHLEATKLTDSERVRLVRGFLQEPVGGPIIVLTTEEIRGHLWSLIFRELPDVTVLAYQDLSPDCNVEPLARISICRE